MFEIFHLKCALRGMEPVLQMFELGMQAGLTAGNSSVSPVPHLSFSKHPVAGGSLLELVGRCLCPGVPASEPGLALFQLSLCNQ